MKTFLIFRFPFGTEPTGLLKLGPDLRTCICYYLQIACVFIEQLYHEICKFESYAPNVEVTVESRLAKQ